MECYEDDPEVSLTSSTALPKPSPKAEPPQMIEDIIVTKVDPKLAFKIFAGSYFDTTGEDYSDAIDKAGPFVGSAKKSSSISETPSERLVRIQRDVQDFKSELESLLQYQSRVQEAVVRSQLSESPSSQVGSTSSIVADSGVGNIFNEFQNLSAQIDALSSLSQQIAAPSQVVSSSASLLAQLEAVAKGTDPSSSSTTSTATSTRPLSSPSLSSSSSSSSAGATLSPAYADIASLERRLAHLESAVGAQGADKLPFADVVSALVTLQQQVSMVQPAHAERALRRARALAIELETLKERASKTSTDPVSAGASASGVLTNEKLQKLHDMLLRTDATAHRLPRIISRLHSLKELHEAEASALTRLHAVQAAQAEVTARRAEDKAALASLQAAMTQNATTLQVNVAALTSKMEALALKMEGKKKSG